MVCDSRTWFTGQTLTERKEQVRSVVEKLAIQLMKRQVTPKISPNGAVTFAGWPQGDRLGVTDACAYRRLMATGNALVKAELAKAEMLAGRKIDPQTVAAGVHSHDGGTTWHSGH